MKMFEVGARLRSALPGTVIVITCALCAHSCRSNEPATIADLMAEANAVFMESLHSSVDDPGRAQQAADVFAAYQSDEAEFLRRTQELRLRMVELNASYEAPREDFEALFAKFDENREELAGSIVETIAELKLWVEPAEWEAVFEGMQELDASWEALAD